MFWNPFKKKPKPEKKAEAATAEIPAGLPPEPLFELIAKLDDPKAIERLRKNITSNRYPALNEKDENGRTALSYVAHTPTVAAQTIAMDLVLYGAQASQEELDLMLKFNASNKDANKLSMLYLRRGANPAAQDPLDGKNALMTACMGQNYELLENMLDSSKLQKDDLARQDKKGRTVLMTAAMTREKYPLLKLLLQYSSHPEMVDDDARTALIYAAIHNPTAVRSFLRGNLDINASQVDKFRKTAADYLILSTNDHNLVQELLMREQAELSRNGTTNKHAALFEYAADIDKDLAGKELQEIDRYLRQLRTVGEKNYNSFLTGAYEGPYRATGNEAVINMFPIMLNLKYGSCPLSAEFMAEFSSYCSDGYCEKHPYHERIQKAVGDQFIRCLLETRSAVFAVPFGKCSSDQRTNKDASDCHANLLIYRKKTNTLEHFDPHGSEGEHNARTANLLRLVDYVNAENRKHHYFDKPLQLIPLAVVCPRTGPQVLQERYYSFNWTGGLCVFFSCLMAQMCLMFPQFSLGQLTKIVSTFGDRVAEENGLALTWIIVGFMVQLEKELDTFSLQLMKSTEFNRGWNDMQLILGRSRGVDFPEFATTEKDKLDVKRHAAMVQQLQNFHTNVLPKVRAYLTDFNDANVPVEEAQPLLQKMTDLIAGLQKEIQTLRDDLQKTDSLQDVQSAPAKEMQLNALEFELIGLQARKSSLEQLLQYAGGGRKKQRLSCRRKNRRRKITRKHKQRK